MPLVVQKHLPVSLVHWVPWLLQEQAVIIARKRHSIISHFVTIVTKTTACGRKITYADMSLHWVGCRNNQTYTYRNVFPESNFRTAEYIHCCLEDIYYDHCTGKLQGSKSNTQKRINIQLLIFINGKTMYIFARRDTIRQNVLLLGHLVKYQWSSGHMSKLLLLGPRAPPDMHSPFPVPDPSSHQPHPGSDRHVAHDK